MCEPRLTGRRTCSVAVHSAHTLEVEIRCDVDQLHKRLNLDTTTNVSKETSAASINFVV
jgi:hypothetical protein